ncbi:exopolysaccharide biosynthesis protein [Azospirillum sp. B506]|uniref:exopolysaccharide biosynthesis protein n=1 Tax=Azospirillum sp. B506 TaxID=137721 RepID=UPI00034959D5|nr:exopolysaccharide biosynthesis protein [Azospirillum sp. B506]
MTSALPAHIPTSEVLRGLLAEAPAEGVTFGWLLDRLHKRSFGVVLLLLAVIGLTPGTSPVVGLLLTIPAFQMILARETPAFPRTIMSRRFSTQRLVRMVDRTVPVLRRMETVIRPRWKMPFETTTRVVGLVVLVLAGVFFVPIPLSNVVPAVTIMLIALAYLEEDGVLLAASLAIAAAVLIATAITVWQSVEAVRSMFF